MSSITKRLLRADRVRKVPRSFSWLDHRLIRDDHLLRLQPGEILLYFFLVLVGDHRGLSYYSLRSISNYLKLPAQELEAARISLCDRGLIAYEAPLYQVLSLSEKEERLAPRASTSAPRGGEPRSVGEILTNVLKRYCDE
jgi:hypothetical protein